MTIEVSSLGKTDYLVTLNKMRQFTKDRDANTPDQIWLTSHPPIYTLGQAGKVEHLIKPTTIPVAKSDRGGQITYHGPGQIVMYVLVDLHRAKYGIRTLVSKIEQSMIDVLATYDIKADRIKGRPGIYIDKAKIGAIGMRVSRGCSYHGCSLNVNTDLSAFANINTCGYTDITDTSMQHQNVNVSEAQVSTKLSQLLVKTL